MDTSLQELATYYGRVAAWYLAGGVVDDGGHVHCSANGAMPFSHYEVLNESVTPLPMMTAPPPPHSVVCSVTLVLYYRARRIILPHHGWFQQPLCKQLLSACERRLKLRVHSGSYRHLPSVCLRACACACVCACTCAASTI